MLGLHADDLEPSLRCMAWRFISHSKSPFLAHNDASEQCCNVTRPQFLSLQNQLILRLYENV